MLQDPAAQCTIPTESSGVLTPAPTTTSPSIKPTASPLTIPSEVPSAGPSISPTSTRVAVIAAASTCFGKRMELRCTPTPEMVKNNYCRTRLREETFAAEATTIATNYNAGLEIGRDNSFCWTRESKNLLRDNVKIAAGRCMMLDLDSGLARMISAGAKTYC